MELNQFIDHTLLKPTATADQIEVLCQEALTYDFFSVCVNSCYVSQAKELLKNTNIKICTVVGFPLGAMSTVAKVQETKQALADGAHEIDMVINLGFLRGGVFDAVRNDIQSVKTIMPDQTLKIILETCYLTEDEIVKASELAIEAGADFIKTSTGFGTGGATTHAVKLMKKAIANRKVGIKASGGIRDTETALQYINLGVQRIGTSNGINIVTGKPSIENNY